MKPARNDPCPCGSGRKYKRCHGAPGSTQASPEESAWRQMRRALDGLPTTMLRFIKAAYGTEAVHEAWDAYILWSDDRPQFDPDSPHLAVFMSWFFHKWMPDPLETTVEDVSLHGQAPTRVLLERRGRRLDPALRGYLEACLDAPFTFHEVVRCDPGRGFHARDVLTGEEQEVWDRSASETLRPGDIVFGLIVSTGGITYLEACAPHVLPPQDKIGLVALREAMAGGPGHPSRDVLADWDDELRDEYWYMLEDLLTPRIPSLHNTDDEAIEFHRLSFEIDSPRAAFDALKHLALDEAEEELLESAERDGAGELLRVELPWKVAGNRVHRSWESTVHGHLEIDQDRLVVNVNSAERAERIRRIVDEALGERGRYRTTERQTVDEALAERRAADEISPAAADEPDLSEHPEVVAHIRGMMAAYYDDWISEEIPALGGLTPLEAVKDEGGREKVEALIAQMERHGRRMRPPLDEAIPRGLRERLGLG